MPPSDEEKRFAQACDRERVDAAHRPALIRLLASWPTAERDRVAWLVEEHRHWQLYVRSRDGDTGAARAFEATWRAAARAYLGRGFTPEQVDELGALFFARVYERAHGFAWATPWTAYLRTVLLNVAREEVRQLRRRRQREVSLESFEDDASGSRRQRARDALSDPTPSAEARALARERDERFTRALASLPAEDRRLLAAFVDESRPAAEIARALGIKRDAVYQRLKRARERLRTLAGEPPVRSPGGRHLPGRGER